MTSRHKKSAPIAGKGRHHDPIREATEIEELQQDSEDWRILKRLLPYLWPKDNLDLRMRVVWAFACLLGAKAVGILAPYLFGRAVDEVARVENGTDAVVAVMISFVLAYAVARFGAVGLQQIRDALFAKVGFRIQRLVSTETFLERRTGGLARVIDRGTKSIEFLLRFSVFNIVPTLLEVVLVATVVRLLLGLKYGLIILGSVAIYVFFTFSITEWRLQLRRRMNARDTEANSKAVDSLLNYETVKYFNNEEVEQNRFSQAAIGYEQAAIKSTVSLSLLNGGQSLIMQICLGVMLVLSALDIASGQLSIGDFAMVNAYLIQLFVPLNFLGFVYREIKQSLVDMGRMFAMLDTHREVSDLPGAKDLVVSKGNVSFENVQFAYNTERPILKDLNFEVEGGHTLAIVGPSGAGKSTISRTLFRFYDITGGKISIDGQSISEVTQASLRRNIGIVPQDTVLFNDTIFYNIRYGRADATDDEVVEAAKMAKIHDFIVGLPEGYDTLVGERGLKLSGGEKQRVAIARTILKNPPILLLDEATSALDTHTEKSIQESLREVAKDRTTLIIAHRLSTVVHAEQLIVLEEGKIVERGTHANLISKDGVYAAMWRRQLEDDRQEEQLEPAE